MADSKNNTSSENTGNWNSVFLDEEDQHLLPVTIDNSTGYAVKKVNGVLRKIHRLVIGAVSGDIVDHINGNKLDNRKKNLRLVTKSQNNRNKNAQGYTKTKHGKYEVKTTFENKTYYIGNYSNEETAKEVFRGVTKFIFEITGIDVSENSKKQELLSKADELIKQAQELRDKAKEL